METGFGSNKTHVAIARSDTKKIDDTSTQTMTWRLVSITLGVSNLDTPCLLYDTSGLRRTSNTIPSFTSPFFVLLVIVPSSFPK